MSAIGQILAMSAGGWVADRWGAQAAFVGSAVLSLPVLAAFGMVKDVRTSKGSGITIQQFGRAITTPRLLLVSLLAACSQYAFFATSLGFATVHAQDLGASDAQLGILTTAVQVGKAIPLALLSMQRRARNSEAMAIAGMGLIAISMFAFPAVTDFRWLVVCQVLTGLGVGLSFPVLMGLALQAVEPRARASAMGVFQSIYALGMTLGPAFSGLFARQWGIWGVYLTNAVLLVLATVVAAVFLRTKRPAPRCAGQAPDPA
jgi:predicted MFS family arabinose efflux permease